MTATETVRAYLHALESGVAGDDLRAFLHDEIVQEEMPNRLYAKGQRRDLAQLLADSVRGRSALTQQRYAVRSIVANGDAVAAEVTWTGTLAVAFGQLAPGAELRAHIAMFFELRDGRIAVQRNYDCYEPF